MGSAFTTDLQMLCQTNKNTRHVISMDSISSYNRDGSGAGSKVPSSEGAAAHGSAMESRCSGGEGQKREALRLRNPAERRQGSATTGRRNAAAGSASGSPSPMAAEDDEPVPARDPSGFPLGQNKIICLQQTHKLFFVICVVIQDLLYTIVLSLIVFYCFSFC